MIVMMIIQCGAFFLTLQTLQQHSVYVYLAHILTVFYSQ